MAKDYNEYLAINVLNEQQLVSYRTLSRALQVHCNRAKQMLFEFHRKQNVKKPGSVHATYLLAGSRRRQHSQQTNGARSQNTEEDGDNAMPSSPPLPSSSIPHFEDGAEASALVRSIILVKEEQLEQAKATFETITSIHIYSLEANTLSNIHVLTECNRQISVDAIKEDPLQNPDKYGTIRNKDVKRREKKAGMPAALVTLNPAPAAPATASKPALPKREDSTASDTKSATGKSAPTAISDTKAPSEPAPQHKSAKSSIFKSFAKTQPPKAKSVSAPSKSKAEQEDAPMPDFSDDDREDDDDADDIDPGAAIEEAAKESKAGESEGKGKGKREREKELQDMMEAEEEESKGEEDEVMEDAEATPASASDALDSAPSKESEPEPTETVQTSNGRRRGRRRVMKKKTVKDEEGYLVTREEAAWESFSEDETPQAPALKKARSTGPLPASNLKGASAGAKKGGKPGQGNIMSFFGKK